MFESLGKPARIELAKDKMPRVLDHILYLLELHANNAYVVYSSLLSSQIPQSFGANAFNIFRRSMHQFEIVRLCALWDSADSAKENIPTVIELIDDAKIIDMLADETRSHWATEAMTSPQPIGRTDTQCRRTERGEAVRACIRGRSSRQRKIGIAARNRSGARDLGIATACLDHEHQGQASGALAGKDPAREAWPGRADDVRRRNRIARTVSADCRAALLLGEWEKLLA